MAPDYEERSTLLSSRDIAALNRARAVLKRIEDAAWRRSLSHYDPFAPVTAWDLGRLSEAASSAEGALFHVLTTARGKDAGTPEGKMNLYPWGDQWIEGAANTKESRLDHTRNVNAYPNGGGKMTDAQLYGPQRPRTEPTVDDARVGPKAEETPEVPAEPQQQAWPPTTPASPAVPPRPQDVRRPANVPRGPIRAV